MPQRVPALQVFVESRRSSRTSCESVTRSFSCDEPEKKKKSKIDNEPKEGEINEIFLSTSCCEFPARASTSVDYCADMNKRELAKINRLANRTMYINARHKEMSRKNSKRKSKKKNKNKKKTKKKNSEVMAPVQKLSYLLGRSVDDYISDCPEDCEPMSSCDPNSWRKAPEGCLTCAKIKECKRPKEKRENKPKKKKAKKKRRCSKDCEFAIKEAAYCRPGTSRNQESQKQYIDRSTSVIVEICEEPRSAPNSQFATKEDRESCESTSRKKYNDRPILVKSEICESSLSTSNSQLTRKEGRISCQCASVNKPSRKKYCDRPVSEDAKSSPDSVDFCTTVSPGRISADKAQNQWENVTQISVKERSQKFDRMASESALNKLTSHNLNVGHKKKHDKTDKDDEDTGSVQLLDGKTREWLVKCAQGDYQAMFKLVTENPKLVKFKDPTSTALHWGAKHGNLDIIKLIAGTHKADVNARTNGGYTPLHLATQLGHEEACTQLVKVYKADENIRDYSGRKPRQYQKTSGTSISADTYRKIKARKKHAAEKDLGFLRIGSLNVRVKKTTEAFSNFLGVGNAEKLHKHWGSADNLPQGDQKRMPPPKIAPIKKRKSKRGQDFTATKPTVIEQQQPAVPLNEPNVQQQDSDSDTAAGFGSTWQSTV